MNSAILNFLLGGALIASLTFNVMSPSTGETKAEIQRESQPSVCCEAVCTPSFSNLDVDPQLLQRIEDLCSSCCGGTNSVQERLESAKSLLRDEMTNEPLDEDQVRSLAADVGELQAEFVRECAETALSIRRMLDRDQFERLWSTCCGQDR